MLNAAELASMRATQAQALPNQATIVRRAYAPSDSGGQIESTTLLTLPCRAATASAKDAALIAGQVVEKPLWRLTFAAGADVRSDDQIRVGGRAFEVLSLLAGGDWETARVALCAER